LPPALGLMPGTSGITASTSLRKRSTDAGSRAPEPASQSSISWQGNRWTRKRAERQACRWRICERSPTRSAVVSAPLPDSLALPLQAHAEGVSGCRAGRAWPPRAAEPQLRARVSQNAGSATRAAPGAASVHYRPQTDRWRGTTRDAGEPPTELSAARACSSWVLLLTGGCTPLGITQDQHEGRAASPNSRSPDTTTHPRRLGCKVAGVPVGPPSVPRSTNRSSCTTSPTIWPARIHRPALAGH
jgi:hypothetical protein